VTTTWTEPPRDWTAGEFVTESIADTHIRDQLKATWHLISRKTADESLTSNTTFQDDNDLLVTVAANEIWRCHWDFVVDAAAAGDMKIQWTFPSGTLHHSSLQYLNASDASVSAFSLSTASPSGSTTLAGISAGSPRLWQFETLFLNGGSAGTLTLQWAQNTSSGTATIMKAHSAVYGMKLA
jgi:hypothetical protein